LNLNASLLDINVRLIYTYPIDTRKNIEVSMGNEKLLRFDHTYEPGAYQVCRRCGDSLDNHRKFEEQKRQSLKTQRETTSVNDDPHSGQFSV
jgi:hypothetical protein